MSILLTAGKKAVRAKRIVKKKRHSQPKVNNFNPTPPLSTPRTVVWYWELCGVPTTVMLTKDSGEVWCNGEYLDTIDSFADEDGGVIDFCIQLDERVESSHKARIRRVTECEPRINMVYQLLVDGVLIHEHSTPGSHVMYADPEPYGDGAYGMAPPPDGPDAFPDLPPTYEEAVHNGQDYGNCDEKKTK